MENTEGHTPLQVVDPEAFELAPTRELLEQLSEEDQTLIKFAGKVVWPKIGLGCSGFVDALCLVAGGGE